jgi:DNA-binding MarR family transcriptional regulator
MKHEKLIKTGLTVRDALILHRIASGCETNESLIDELTGPNITRITDKLVAKKLITRRHHPSDRRRYVYTITAKGKELA